MVVKDPQMSQSDGFPLKAPGVVGRMEKLLSGGGVRSKEAPV